jgi:hypothetical protein
MVMIESTSRKNGPATMANSIVVTPRFSRANRPNTPGRRIGLFGAGELPVIKGAAADMDIDAAQDRGVTLYEVLTTPAFASDG